MPVALGKQDPAERHALPGRPQADVAQHALHVVPGASVEIGSTDRPHGAADGLQAKSRAPRLCARKRLHRTCSETGWNEIVSNAIISVCRPNCNAFATGPLSMLCWRRHEPGTRRLCPPGGSAVGCP